MEIQLTITFKFIALSLVTINRAWLCRKIRLNKKRESLTLPHKQTQCFWFDCYQQIRLEAFLDRNLTSNLNSQKSHPSKNEPSGSGPGLYFSSGVSSGSGAFVQSATALTQSGSEVFISSWTVFSSSTVFCSPHPKTNRTSESIKTNTTSFFKYFTSFTIYLQEVFINTKYPTSINNPPCNQI